MRDLGIVDEVIEYKDIRRGCYVEACVGGLIVKGTVKSVYINDGKAVVWVTISKPNEESVRVPLDYESISVIKHKDNKV